MRGDGVEFSSGSIGPLCLRQEQSRKLLAPIDVQSY